MFVHIVLNDIWLLDLGQFVQVEIFLKSVFACTSRFLFYPAVTASLKHPHLKVWNNSSMTINFANQLSSELKGFMNWTE